MASVAGCASPGPHVEHHELWHEDTALSYELFVPSALRKPTPLLVALHRFTETGALMARLTGFNEIAEREGFVVVYPNGTGRRFEAWESEGRDDASRVLAILDDVGARLPIDAGRIYLTGASNGGFLTHRLAGLAPGTFAAAAPVMALMPRALAEEVPDGAPVPMLMIHGTEDKIVPPDAESVFAGAKYEVLPFDETVGYWVRRNRSSPEAHCTGLMDTDPEDGTRGLLFVHQARPGGVETRYIQIMGGGHTWPGGLERAPSFVVGKTSRDFSASEAIWAFFARHGTAQASGGSTQTANRR